MLILAPRVLTIIALALGGAFLATRKAEEGAVREWKVSHAADQVIVKRVSVPDGAAERARAQATLRFEEAVDNRPPPRKPLTVESLVAEIVRVSALAPRYVPTVPLMGRLAQAMLREDPGFITFGELEPGVGGVFRWTSDGKGDPKIVLSNDLRRLHEKGVPAALIAPVLAHELDHFFEYMAGRTRTRSRHQIEKSAHVSSAAYLDILRYSGPGGYTGRKKGDGEVVDSRAEDSEVAAYYRYLRKLRASLFGGRVDELVHEHYGTGGKP